MGQVVFLPPPVMGLNTRDPENLLQITEASVMTNLIPRRRGLVVRQDGGVYKTSFAAYQIKTLAKRAAASAEFLYAAVNGNIYVVTSSTATSLGSGFTNDIWQTVNGVDAVLFLNGDDAPQQVNSGATLQQTYYTGSGLTTTDLISGTFYRNRLYMLEKATGSVWYMDTTDAIGSTNVGSPSAVTELDLSASINGQLVVIGTWTFDDSGGLDDRFVVISEDGDLLVFQGSYPGGSDWTKVGQFKVPPPASRRCLVNYGGDCWILTRSGVLSLARLMQSAEGGSPIVFISDKIRPSIEDALNTSSKRTWAELVIYEHLGLLIINCNYDSTNYTTDQYVMDLETQAWCKFEDLNAATLLPLAIDADSRELIFAKVAGTPAAVVYNITASSAYDVYPSLKQAPVDFGIKQMKRVSSIRPVFAYEVTTEDSSEIIAISFDTDLAGVLPFDESWVPTLITIDMPALGNFQQAKWTVAAAEGIDLALMLSSDPDGPLSWNNEITYLGADIEFQVGGIY